MKTFKLVCQCLVTYLVVWGLMLALVAIPMHCNAADEITKAMDVIASALDKDDLEAEDEPRTYCPATSLTLGEGVSYSNCTNCHTEPTWAVKEGRMFDTYNLPYGLELKFRDGGPVAYTQLEGISTATKVQNSFDWLMEHPDIKTWVMELHSPGGSMLTMKQIKGVMDMFKYTGGVVETVCMGWAASAAFDILVNGTIGHRFVHPQALLMWHEVAAVKWGVFVEDVSDLEDQSETMRFFQDLENEWIASRSKVTKDELDEMIKRKELWVSGIDAVEKYGFADGFIGEQK